MVRNKILIGAILLIVAFTFFQPQEAFAKKKKKKKTTTTVVEELPPLKGPKKTIAVLSFENKSNYAAEVAIGSEFSEMLTEALMKTDRFIVVARQELGAIITEQDLAASARFAESKTAQKGKLVPAQIIIKGAVTEFEARTSGGGADFRFGGFGAGDFGIGGESEKAHVAVIIYIIDTATGQVLDSQRVEGKAKAGGLAFDWSYDHFGFGTSGFNKTPLGKATQAVIYEGVNYIAARLNDVPWTGRIVKVEGSKAYLNAGKNANIFSGDAFSVYREEETLTDPITGAPLGEEKRRIGNIRVSEVKDKYSIANIIGRTEEVKRGDLLLIE